MTKDLSIRDRLLQSPKVGLDIFKGLKREKEVIYTPGFWRYHVYCDECT